MGNNNEVIIGDRRHNSMHQRQPGITGLTFWEGAFPSSDGYNNADKIMEFPEISDPAGIFQRAIFRNEEMKEAQIQLWNLAEKHGITRAKNTIRNAAAASRGWYGFGSVLHLSAYNGMMAPGVIREQLQMKKVENGEDVQRGSDFREQRATEINDK